MTQEQTNTEEGQDIAGRPGYKKLANGIVIGPDGKP
jgi:FAD-linked sulfhydryl oxidase